MLPQPMSRSEPSADDLSALPQPDLVRLLEQHVHAGFPPDLALDLVLNELVVRAADATHASAAALALLRGDEMVCRAATGLHAPDLGVPLNTHDGLSGACVRTRTPQLCSDTESDPRVDAAFSRRLGIRSILIVPVFNAAPHSLTSVASDALLHAGVLRDGHVRDASHGAFSRVTKQNEESQLEVNAKLSDIHKSGNISEIHSRQLAGVLEIFSPLPNDFSPSDQVLLEDFADDCARICRAAANITAPPAVEIVPVAKECVSTDVEHVPASERSLSTGDEFDSPASASVLPALADDFQAPVAHSSQPYESWTLILGALVILAAAAVSFLIGSRIGWIRSPQSAPSASRESVASFPPAASVPSSAGARASKSPPTKRASKTSAMPTNKARAGSSDELVVYEKGKVIFRVTPTPAESGASSTDQPSGADHGRDSAADHATSDVAGPVAHTLSGARATQPQVIWLAPAQAESRLLNRVEPVYPADALAVRRSGDVTLEVRVAEDGTVSSVRTLSGDPLLAAAAAEAVRNWHYQPYRQHDHPSPFQTDVTLTFSLPN